MISDFLLRLVIALPVILLAIVGTLILLKRTGWTLPRRRLAGKLSSGAGQLEIHDIQVLTPTARLAVVRFAENNHLIGITASGITLLTSADKKGQL